MGYKNNLFVNVYKKWYTKNKKEIKNFQLLEIFVFYKSLELISFHETNLEMQKDLEYYK